MPRPPRTLLRRVHAIPKQIDDENIITHKKIPEWRGERSGALQPPRLLLPPPAPSVARFNRSRAVFAL